MSGRARFTKTRASPSRTPKNNGSAIDALGHRVDDDLQAGDVRLTMGGEPTFVSIDDRDGAGMEHGRPRAEQARAGGRAAAPAARSLCAGRLLHFGQGKWYPGESLPRWALGCYWRKDGVPSGTIRALIAEDEPRLRLRPEDAQRFIDALATRLGVDPSHCAPGLRGRWYYLWQERRLPVNVDPLEERSRRPEERARLAKIFEQGLGKIVGYALPLR